MISLEDIESLFGRFQQGRRRGFSISTFFDCPMPWFGIDIGGTLTKLVYFEPTDQADFLETEDERMREKTIHRYLTTNKAYGETGVRDVHLQLNGVNINGRVGVIHFIRFPTDRMMYFIKLVRSKGFAQVSSTVCATGGGAIKYAKDAEDELGMFFHKADELQSLINGIEFVAANNADECYYYENALDEHRCRKVFWRWSSARCSSTDQKHADEPKPDGLQYPYVVCNIGSGVSVLVVRGHNDFVRVSGSSIGGGFFQGLCFWLCGCETFDEAIRLAASGDNTKVDKLVGDIYGKGYESVGLPEDVIAASFAKVLTKEKAAAVRKEDLARSVLVTTTNNIGSIALNAATQHGIERIVFVGNFLRVNPIAARLLSHAMDFWSQGTKKALFLHHEGYFGAVGCLGKLVDVTNSRRMAKSSNRTESTTATSSTPQPAEAAAKHSGNDNPT
uniref:pantothenate kinase n=1 Tax=Globodera rostochiensis TaxID=31243 RepID=A0A914HAV2_GLORO